MTIWPSSSFCGVIEPCGSADHLPTCTEAEPLNPSCLNAAAMLADSSPCVMPAVIVWNAASYAAIVASLARCISAISAAVL